MMKNRVILISVFAVSCASTATIDSELTAAPVIAAERAFAERHQAVSVKQSFLEYSAADGVAIWNGKVENVKESLKQWPDANDAGRIAWWPTFASVSRSDDLGFTTGPASFDGGKRYSNYFTIWKKQADGSWKWMIDLGTRQGVKPSGAPGEVVAVVPVSTLDPIPQEQAWQELFAIDTALGKAMASDVGALGTYLAPETQLIGFEAKPAIGIDAARAAIARRPKAFSMRPEGGGVSQAGDLGWTYGFATWTENGESKRGPYLRAWQRRSSGWVILVDNVHAF